MLEREKYIEVWKITSKNKIIFLESKFIGYKKNNYREICQRERECVQLEFLKKNISQRFLKKKKKLEGKKYIFQRERKLNLRAKGRTPQQ